MTALAALGRVAIGGFWAMGGTMARTVASTTDDDIIGIMGIRHSAESRN